MRRDVEPLPGYPEPYGLLAAILQDGTREWRGEVDADLCEDAVAWQPSPGMPSIAHLMLHNIGVEIGWFERTVLKRDWNLDEVETLMLREIDVDAGRWPEVPRRPISWYFELHDRIRERTLAEIKNWPPADVPLDDDVEETTPRWVLGHIIQHEAYHGGQIVLLNRMWNLENPGR